MKRVLSKPAVRIGLLLLLLLLLLAVGAGIVAYMQTQNTAAFSYADLLAALRTRGASVQERGAASWWVWPSVTGHQLSVNGAQVDAYEYGTTSAAQADAGRVSSNGSTFRTGSGPSGGTVVHVDYFDGRPHHFRRGRVIASYIGDDRAIIELLMAVLGPQFAGGDMPGDHVWLLDRLRAAGASVALIDHRPNQAPIAGTLPMADAYDVRVNTAAVLSIFEFADRRAAGTYAHHIQGGNYVDTDLAAHISIVVNYAGRPHFYLADKVIVLYVGADVQTLRLLRSILGPPFTEGPV